MATGDVYIAGELHTSDGKLYVVDSGGGGLPSTLGQQPMAGSTSVTIASDQTAIPTTLESLISGENQSKNWLGVVNAANGYESVNVNAIDQVIGSTGAIGDYIELLWVNVFNPNNSSVFLLDGTPTNTISVNTHASTPCTTTSIVTANTTVTLNQLVGQTLKIASQKRRITANTAATGASTTITLDHALSAVPGTGVALTVENYSNSHEIVPAGQPVGAYAKLIRRASQNGAWKITTDSGVQVVPTERAS